MFVEANKKTSESRKPLSNSEVRQLLASFEKGNELGSANFVSDNEQGSELRKQTMLYIECYNEFQLDRYSSDIRE